jgi:flagellar protein FliO/FliZ
MDPLMLALRVILSLGAVVGVIWFVQKRVNGHQSRTRTGDPLTVVARRGIGAKASVVVLDTGGKRFVLGVTEHAVNVLHTDDAPDPAEVPATAPAASAKSFSLAFARATGAAPAEPEPSSETPLGPLRRVELATASPLAGSILSPDTWKQAAAALRKGPIR